MVKGASVYMIMYVLSACEHFSTGLALSFETIHMSTSPTIVAGQQTARRFSETLNRGSWSQLSQDSSPGVPKNLKRSIKSALEVLRAGTFSMEIS